MSEEMNGVEETKGDEPEETEPQVAEDETEPQVAYPVPLATEAEAAPQGGLTSQLSEYIWGKPKRILRQAKNKEKDSEGRPRGLPNTEETPA